MSSDFLEEGSDLYLPDVESQEVLEPGSLYEQVKALTEEYDYSYPVRENIIDDTEVVHIGATHVIETFGRFQDFYEDCIDSADAVVVEDPAGMDFYDSPFFGSLGMIAAGQGKNVYEVDPSNFYTFTSDIGLAGYGSSNILLEGFDALNGGGMDDAAAAFAGAYIAYGTLFGHELRFRGERMVKDEKLHVGDSHTMEYSLKDKIQWGEVDWRNIMMAENIETICEEEDFDQLITFQGAGHTHKIAGYLDDRTLRKIKKAAYLPFQILSGEERKLKKFESTESDEWKKDTWPFSEE